MSSNVFAANVYYSGNVIVSQTLNVATINVTSTVSGTTLTASTAVNTSGTGVYQVAGTTVIDASRNLTNIGTVGSGAITSTSTVSGTTITASSSFSGPGTNLTGTAASLNVGGTSGGLSGTPNITVGTVVEGITTASATPAAAANVLTVIGSSTTGNVVQFSNSAGGRFVMTSGGNVGVGVTNPTQALEVAGSAVVAGTLSAGNPLMFRNALYNGDMRIAQRGTTGLGFNSYTLDRWYISSYGAGGSVSVSQIQSGLANFSNALQLQSTSTSSANFWLSQSLETRDVVRFQGQAVTVSFWYRIPTSFTQGWVAYLVWSTAVDTKLIDNGVTNTGAGSLALPNTTAWTYASFQAFVPPTAQSLALQLNSVGGNTVNGAQFQLTGVQLEKGSVATPFEVRPYATELALCQRYCETSFPQGTTPAQQLSSYFWGTAMSGGSGGLYIPIQFQVRKRVAPTSVSLYRPSTLGSGTWGFVYPGTGWVATPTPTTTTTENGMLLETTGGTSTAGNAYLTGGHWLVSSEL
jgi:hypothetical protein